MTDERNDLILRHLRDIRAKQDDHGRILEGFAGRFDELERQINRISKVLTFGLGQNTETQFRQAEQEKRIDDVFEKLERLLASKEPA